MITNPKKELKMARINEPETDGTAGVGHNMSPDERKARIRDLAERMTDIKEERSALNEKAAEIRQSVRDLGLQTDAFNLAMRLFALEEKTEEVAYLDSLREFFSALDIGGQGEMFPSNTGPEIPGESTADDGVPFEDNHAQTPANDAA